MFKPEDYLRPGLGFEIESVEGNSDSSYNDLPERFKQKLGTQEQVEQYFVSVVREGTNPDENEWVYDNLLRPYFDGLKESLEKTFDNNSDLVRKYMQELGSMFSELIKNALDHGPHGTGSLISAEYFLSKNCAILSIRDEGDFYASLETKSAFESKSPLTTLFPSTGTREKQNYGMGMRRIMTEISPENRYVDTDTKTLYLLLPLTI